MNRNTAMSRLQDACRKNGPLCIGLDTDPSYLPESVIANYPSKEDAVLAVKQNSRHYAKRQLTWFRRDERYHWLDISKNIDIDELI